MREAIRVAHAYVTTHLVSSLLHHLEQPLRFPLVDNKYDLHIHSATPHVSVQSKAYAGAAAMAMVALAAGRRVKRNVAVFGYVHGDGSLGGMVGDICCDVVEFALKQGFTVLVVGGNEHPVMTGEATRLAEPRGFALCQSPTLIDALGHVLEPLP